MVVFMHRHPLILVIKDLWYFVTSEVIFLLPLTKKSPQLPAVEGQRLVGAPLPRQLLGSATEKSDSVLEQLEQMSALLAHPQNDQSDGEVPTATPHYFAPHNPAVMYVATESSVCTLTPQKNFDSVLAKFSYGTAVAVIGYQGEYAKVFWSHHEGWVRKDDLTPHKAEVWPQLTAGETYLGTHDAVIKIRLLINDAFYAGELALPLQAGEWVEYRLREENRSIPWPVSYGRVPGDWQVLLKGAPGIHSSVSPKTDSIMEWRGDDGIGRVAYVEKVAPDLTITMTVAGYEFPGCFEKRTLAESAWRELRPVFIEVL